MALAIFDLDNTLLQGDSDHEWGEFMIAKGLVDAESYKKQNDQFYQDYLEGNLDIYAYQNFCLSAIAKLHPGELEALLDEYLKGTIENFISQKSLDLIEKHRNAGDTLLIITATNEIITRPIAKRLGIEHLIATMAEKNDDGSVNGKVAGIASYSQGKIERLKLWLQERQEDYDKSMQGSYFYSDSHNDIPLLELVDNPVVVDPDDKLRAHGEANDWPIISLRE